MCSDDRPARIYRVNVVILSLFSTDSANKHRSYTTFTAQSALVMSQCGTVLQSAMVRDGLGLRSVHVPGRESLSEVRSTD